MEPKDPSTQLEVTLRHPSFGEYVFRCEPEELGNVADDMLSEAHASHEQASKIAAIDREQLELVEKIAKIDERIAAARVLNDTARMRKEADDRADVEDAIAALATKREASKSAGPSPTFDRG